MGNHTSQIISVPTTKLIFENGDLQEFRNPVKVSEILNRNYFICKADDMDYDDYISAVDDDEVLQLGQLYFALPLTWLDKPLRAPAMAALAVKASLALKNRTLGDPNMVSSNYEKAADLDGRGTAVRGGRDGGGKGLEVKRKGRSGGRRRSKFHRNLTVIMEE
ncbi:hypothetical protein M5689_015173 [Euphorbia peplus]|nr:hypothetical protein M5689_015173 [Euphorbia peplus]